RGLSRLCRHRNPVASNRFRQRTGVVLRARTDRCGLVPGAGILVRTRPRRQRSHHPEVRATACEVDRMRVLHVESGRSYGGSLRALEVYLRYSAASEMEHELLLEHPLAEFERIVPFVAAVHRVSLEPPVQP